MNKKPYNERITSIKDPLLRGWYKYRWNMLHRYKNGFIMVITGKPGSGKSYCALTDSWIIDEDFSIKNVAFTPIEFLDIIETADTGDSIIFEEAGVNFGSRNWQSEVNILLGQVFQTMRYKRLHVIFTVPDISFVDKQLRRVLHCYAEVTRSGDEPAVLKPFIPKFSKQKNKTFDILPRLKIGNESQILHTIKYKKLPPKELLKEYETAAREYKQKVEKEARLLLSPNEIKSCDTSEEIINMIKENPKRFMNAKEEIDPDIIEEELGLSNRRSRRIKKLIDRDNTFTHK